jgi:hypothetical protein
MSKSSNKNELSKKGQAALDDINNLIERYNTYDTNIQQLHKKGTLVNSSARLHDSCMSVIDGLGAEQFRNHLTTEQKQEFIDSMRETSSVVAESIIDKGETRNLAVNTAKAEASIKGFELPLIIDGRAEELKMYGLSLEKDYRIIIEATKEAMLEFAGKRIPEQEYVDMIGIFIKDKLASKFPLEKMESVNQIINQGKKLKDTEKPLEKRKFTQEDLKSLQEATIEAATKFKDILAKNKEQSIEAKSNAVEVIESAVNSLNSKGLSTTEERKSKIIRSLSSVVMEMDPEYLEANKGEIISNLSKELQSHCTMMGNIRGQLRVSRANRTDLANKISQDYPIKYDNFVQEKISKTISIQGIAKTDMSTRLNNFMEATSSSKKYDQSQIPSDKDLVSIRKRDPKLFDQIFLDGQLAEIKKSPTISGNEKKTELKAQPPQPENQPDKTTEPKISEAKINASINAIRGDFEGISGFIAGEFTKIAKANNGVIDINNPSFAKAADSLINADPKIINSPENVKKRGGRTDAVLSFTATKQGIEEKIDNLISKGADPKNFTDLKEDLIKFESKLKKQISTSEGIKELVTEKLTKDFVGKQTNLLVQDKNGKAQIMPMNQKKDLITQIANNVKFGEAAISMLFSSDKNSQALADMTVASIIKTNLGKKDGNFYVLDESKLSKQNLEKLGKLTSEVATQSPIVNEVVGAIEKAKRLGVNQARRAKILVSLAPALAKLGSEYLKQNKESIVLELTNDLYSKGSFRGSFSGELRVSEYNRDQVADKLLKNHLQKSENFTEQKALKQAPQASQSQKNQKEDAIKEVIDQTVKTYEERYKGHIKKEIKERITDVLKPELQKLSIDSLNHKKGEIVLNLSQSLENNKTFFSKFSKNYDIASSGLSFVAKEFSASIKNLNELEKKQSNKPEQTKIPNDLQKKLQSNVKMASDKTISPISRDKVNQVSSLEK